MGITWNNLGLILGVLAIGISLFNIVVSLFEGTYSFGENELGILVGALLILFYFHGGFDKHKKK